MGEEIDLIPILLEKAETLMEEKSALSGQREHNISMAHVWVGIAQTYALLRIHEVLERAQDGKN